MVYRHTKCEALDTLIFTADIIPLIWFTAGMTGCQGMLTPPENMIPLLVYVSPGVRVRPVLWFVFHTGALRLITVRCNSHFMNSKKWLRYQRVTSLKTQLGVTSQINKWANTDPGPAGGGIRCLWGVSIPCQPITPTVSPVPWSWMRSYPLSVKVSVQCTV
jgi:hypothetical protein